MAKSSSGFGGVRSLEFPVLHPYYRRTSRRFAVGLDALQLARVLAFVSSNQRTQKVFSQHFGVVAEQQVRVEVHIAVSAQAEALELSEGKALARHKLELAVVEQAEAQALDW